MGFSAKIICDSISPNDVRLTTFEICFPRIVLAEFNTHRVFCLAGDAELEFDLPSGAHGYNRRVWRMRLDEFVDKWTGGARRVGANPKRAVDLSWIEDSREYTSHEAAARFGMANPSSIHAMCRSGVLTARRARDGRAWLISGSSLRAWREHSPEHTRFDMRSRLAGMRIRQFNEDTGDVQWSHVVNACVSGIKPVFEVRAGDFSVAGSADHLVLTTTGYKTIGAIEPGDRLIVRKFGKRSEDKLDPLRLKKIGGVWRSRWQLEMRAEAIAVDPLCRRCRVRPVEEVHHVVPVYAAPERAFDETNITFLCDTCHTEAHVSQGWQGGTYLYGGAAAVEEVVERGEESTYDLEIAGRYPNFFANGVAVHNSRNSASSRAIPVEKRIAMVEADPFIPVEFGRNQKGMQAGEALEGDDARASRDTWLLALEHAILYARVLAGRGVHKQLANRLLEPFCWHTVVVTATEWSNFFGLRCNPAAQPEIRTIAEAMQYALSVSPARMLAFGQWHLPYVTGHRGHRAVAAGFHQLDDRQLARISAARCARVSYLTHDGVCDWRADLDLATRLEAAGHMSPFEHPAFVSQEHGWIANFRGPWYQLRKLLPNEADFSKRGEAP